MKTWRFKKIYMLLDLRAPVSTRHSLDKSGKVGQNVCGNSQGIITFVTTQVTENNKKASST